MEEKVVLTENEIAIVQYQDDGNPLPEGIEIALPEGGKIEIYKKRGYPPRFIIVPISK